MNKINVLPTEIANKISAGEVVERPASVIKELVENSIDAGATNIIIEIKNGGIAYMRVTDNGCGISPNDIKTAFLPHATSKISDEEDLFSIDTLGFRGEALASIAAVSNVEIMSKTKDEAGTLLQISGGKITDEKTIGCPNGTTIVVKNLFFNTPARMKFLKKDSTEASYITDIVERLVMANPGICIRYIVDEREKLFVSGDGDLKSCIYSIYGRDYANGCIPVLNDGEGIKISGFIGKRELSRGNRAFQSIYVNGRYVKNRSITAVVENAYKNNLMVGKFPFFVICINVPFSLVDINVHPTKQEVKFANERQVCDGVYWAVKGALEKDADDIRNSIRSNSFTNIHSYERPVVNQQDTKQTFWQNISVVKKEASKPVNEWQIKGPVPGDKPVVEKAKEIFSNTQLVLEEQTKELPEREPELNYKTVGQIFDTYIIIELEKQIVLIDQHAAHERMIYQKLMRQNEKKDVAYQVLLNPIAVVLSPEEYVLAEDKRDILSKYGFVTEDFGSNTMLVRQVPISMSDEDIKKVILDIINHSSTDYMEEIIHTIACKAAIKANKRLSDLEIDELIRLFVKEGGVNTCPHGRPIMIKVTKYELEKMFKRIQ